MKTGDGSITACHKVLSLFLNCSTLLITISMKTENMLIISEDNTKLVEIDYISGDKISL